MTMIIPLCLYKTTKNLYKRRIIVIDSEIVKHGLVSFNYSQPYFITMINRKNMTNLMIIRDII